MKTKIQLLSVVLLAFSIISGCKKEDNDIIPISESQKLILGKWKQTLIFETGDSTVNLLPDCEKAVNTVFDCRPDGICSISNSAGCTFIRESSYAISADGKIFAIEGQIYTVISLTSSRFIFETQNKQFRQIWTR